MRTAQTEREARGLSVRQLTFIFFGAVGICALFFALGFLVGVNRRSASSAPAVEQVPPPSAIPPAVDAPLQSAAAGPHTANAPQSTVIEQNLKTASQPPAAVQAQSSPSAEQSAVNNEKAAARAKEKKAAPSMIDSSARAGRGIMVQVAALRTERDAQSLDRTLKSRGYPAVVLNGAASRDGLYRVQVGPFTSRDAALRTLHRLSSQGFRPFIRQ